MFKWLEGIKIIETKDGIKVENIYGKRTMCTIVSKKNYKQGNLRIFDIQTVSKKGTLSEPQTIGLYTSEYESYESIPDRPNEIQKKALSSIQKKVNYVIKPLNDDIQNKKCELEKQKKLVLDRRRKKQSDK